MISLFIVLKWVQSSRWQHNKVRFCPYATATKFWANSSDIVYGNIGSWLAITRVRILLRTKSENRQQLSHFKDATEQMVGFALHPEQANSQICIRSQFSEFHRNCFSGAAAMNEKNETESVLGKFGNGIRGVVTGGACWARGRGGGFEKGVKIHLKEEINKKAKSLKFSASALTRLFRLSLNFKWRQLSFVRTPLTPASV